MKNTLAYICKNLLRILSLLFAVCLGAFVLLNLSPLDPVRAYVGAESAIVSQEQMDKIADHWGLNDPPVVRFLKWGTSVLRGDLGTSMIYRRPVSDIIGEKFAASILLMGSAWLLSGVLGFVLGIAGAMNRGKFIDSVIKWFSLMLASTPSFWFGLLMLIIFAVKLRWFPIGLGVPAGTLAADVSFSDTVRHMILPAVTLSIIGVANIAQHTREKLIDILGSNYVLYARSRGESEWTILRRHGLRNILLPAVTLQFASFSELFGGSMLTEQVFSYPGLGLTVVSAGIRGDVPLLLGITLISSVFVFTGNLIANVLYGFIDPQIREENRDGEP